jgi:hypothetical protein
MMTSYVINEIFQESHSMHFVVSWDLSAEQDRWVEINRAMLEALNSHDWLRLLPAFYILEIESEKDWQVIQDKLLSAAQRYSGEVNFLMSPIYDSDSNFFVYQMPENSFYRT